MEESRTNKIQLPEHDPETDPLELIPIASENKRRFKGSKNNASRQLSKPNNLIIVTKIAALNCC
jgi:hypothetical protein